MVGLMNEKLTLKPFISTNSMDEKEYGESKIIYGAVEQKQEIGKSEGLEFVINYNLILTTYLDIKLGDLIDNTIVKSIAPIKNRHGIVEHLEIITK